MPRFKTSSWRRPTLSFSDFIDILSAFEPYWIEGYTSATPDEAYRLFITGEVPFLLANAAVDMERVLRDAEFTFGVSYFPPITGSTSHYAANNENSYLVGGFTSGYTVTERAEREGVSDQVVGFSDVPDRPTAVVRSHNRRAEGRPDAHRAGRARGVRALDRVSRAAHPRL